MSWKPSEATAMTRHRLMTKEEATARIVRFLGRYPSLNLHDPKHYAAELALLLTRHSVAVGDRALTEASRKNDPNFIPSIPAIEAEFEALTATTKFASQWEAQSREQLRERDEIETQAEPLERRREVAKRILDDYHASLTPEAAKPKPDPWQRFSAEDLLAKYPPKHPKQEAAE